MLPGMSALFIYLFPAWTLRFLLSRGFSVVAGQKHKPLAGEVMLGWGQLCPWQPGHLGLEPKEQWGPPRELSLVSQGSGAEWEEGFLSSQPKSEAWGCGELLQPLGGRAALQTRAEFWAPAPAGGRAGSASGVCFSFWPCFYFPSGMRSNFQSRC